MNKMIYKMILVVGVIAMALLIAGCSKTDSPTGEATKGSVKLFKSESCGCCTGYATYMGQKGYDVEINQMETLNAVKDEQGIPSSLQSCHTMVVGDYFVEGHVPVEAIEKLLAEKPDIKGIALPGMPSASPGMPGSKKGDFVIYAVKNDGSSEEFMRI